MKEKTFSKCKPEFNLKTNINDKKLSYGYVNLQKNPTSKQENAKFRLVMNIVHVVVNALFYCFTFYKS